MRNRQASGLSAIETAKHGSWLNAAEKSKRKVTRNGGATEIAADEKQIDALVQFLMDMKPRD